MKPARPNRSNPVITYSQGASSPGLPPLRLAHAKLAASVAEAVGVASVRRLLLAASADALSMSFSGALGGVGGVGAAEAFGQSEALTTRLRHIIQDYPEGPGLYMHHDCGWSPVTD